ncbi:MAG TPA: rhodanese-like domain-containing protein [Anaeromyxobacter sp.]|nr:rhodanese-like domain-containing protein [Anaeromyxobacter sp.]
MTIDPWTVAALGAVAFVLFKRFGGKRVSPIVVKQKIEAGAKVLDVRSPEEFRGGAYPGAVNIPVQSLAGRLAELPKDRPIVVYCASGGRSAVAARLLAQAGYADVVNAGGLGDMPR